MQKINTDKFNNLIRSGQVLIADSAGRVMVFLSSDGYIIKRFPCKKKFLSKRFSRAFRFQNNCRRLRALQFETITVKEMFDYPEGNCHVATYPIIEGLSLEEYIDGDSRESQKVDMMMRVAAYYGKLHDKGVYCRPTHFRNILIGQNSEFALIDVQNIRFRNYLLDLWTRSRNFKYILKYKKNLNQVVTFGANDFFNSYMSECRMGNRKQKIFQSLLRHNVPALFREGAFRTSTASAPETVE